MSTAVNTVRFLRDDGYRLVAPPIAVATFDPSGEGDDYSALTIQQREEWQLGTPDEPGFAVRMHSRLIRAERMPVGSEFPDNKARLLRIARQLIESTWFADWKLVIEANGIGGPYIDELRPRLPLGKVMKITTVALSRDDKPVAKSGWVMPRQAGLDNLRAGMELQQVKIDKTLRDKEGGKDLQKELRTMVWNGRRPEAQQGAHDDLVMSWALGYWVATKILPRTVRATPTPLRKAA